MARRVALPQSRLKKRRRVQRVRVGIVIGLLALVAIGAIIGCTWIPFIRIHGIAVSGTEVVAPADIQAIAMAELKGRYLFIIPRDNIFLYPNAEITLALMRRYPTLQHATVRAQNFQSLSVLVAERHPSALYCGPAPESTEGCMLMDETGFAYAPAGPISGDGLLSYYGPATTTRGYTSDVMPQRFLVPEQFGALTGLVKALADTQKDTAVLAVSVDANGDVKLSFMNGFSILFRLADKGSDVLERYTLGLESDPFKAHQISDFAYLDLRFGDKLYYHLKLK